MKVKLTNVILAFPHVFELDRFERFSATALVERGGDNVKKMRSAIEEVAKEKWGKKAPSILKQLNATDKLCLRDGDAKADYAGFEGRMFVAASEPNVRPVVKDQDGRTDITAADGKVYPGLICNVMIDVWAQDNPQYGKRVNANLLGLQKVRDGERLAGGAQLAEDDFEAIPDAEMGNEDGLGEDESGFEEAGPDEGDGDNVPW